MEVKGAALLYTVATLAITFAGFAALPLVAAARRRQFDRA